MLPAATPEEEVARAAAQWLQPDDGPDSPEPMQWEEPEFPPGFQIPLHPLDPYNLPEPEEEPEEDLEEDPEEEPEEEQEAHNYDADDESDLDDSVDGPPVPHAFWDDKDE